MEARELLNALLVAERLKDTTRHCYTRNGRHESVCLSFYMNFLFILFIFFTF